MKRYIHILLTSLVATAVMAQPKFSRQHELIDGAKSISVTISGNPAAVIRYTTDGSTPTKSSKKYESSLQFRETTILRAVEQIGDSLSPVATASYIFVSSVLSQPNNPEGYPAEWGRYTQEWGTAIADYEMDPEMTGNAKLQPKIVEGLKQLPILSIVSDKDNFFSHENDEERGGIYIFTGPPVGDATGHGWTRPTSVELFGGPQNHDLSTTCGIRLHGGHGRLAEKNPKHSFRLVFKEKYGPKTLKYPLFGEASTGKYDQLVLRCHFGNAWQHWDGGNRQRAQYTRDVWARRMQRKIGDTAVDALYVHLFINGMYWGLYNIAERVDKVFGKDHLGGKEKDIDIIKIEEDGGNHIEASEGTLDAWEQMLATVSAVGSSAANESLVKLDTLLDVDNFIDYMLINQYAGNTDWDHHNWYAIRRHDNDSLPSEGFRFLCWDSEIIFEHVNENLSAGSEKQGFPTTIFRNLMKNNAFAHRYLRRAKQLLSDDGLLGERSVRAVWDSLYYTIDKALYAEAARWGDYRRDVHPWTSRGQLYTVDDFYLPERNRLLTQYFPYRADIVLDQILDYVGYDVDDFGVPADWVALTANMFHQWEGTDADARVVNDNPGAELNLDRDLGNGGVVAGFSSVAYNLFADVSQFDKLVIRGTGGRLRILANRLEDHGDFKEVGVSLNESDSHWDGDLQAIVLPLSELRNCNTQREGKVRHDAFIHINAIKVDNGTAKISGMWLIPAVQTNIQFARSASADATYYNLQGQRVTQPVRGGIYIVNGRKVIYR